jgi:hypothetical protein
MGHATLKHLLEEAESLVRHGARNIIHQLGVVRTLERAGQDAEMAREHLVRLEFAHTRQVAYRNRLVRELGSQ